MPKNYTFTFKWQRPLTVAGSICIVTWRKGVWGRNNVIQSHRVCKRKRSGWLDGSTKRCTLTWEKAVRSRLVSFNHDNNHSLILNEAFLCLNLPKPCGVGWEKAFISSDLLCVFPADGGIIIINVSFGGLVGGKSHGETSQLVSFRNALCLCRACPLRSQCPQSHFTLCMLNGARLFTSLFLRGRKTVPVTSEKDTRR